MEEKIQKRNFDFKKVSFVIIMTLFLFISFFLGFFFRERLKYVPYQKTEIIKNEKEYQPIISQEEAIIGVVENSAPAVVSIIVTKEMDSLRSPFHNDFERFFGPSPREIGGGTGFIISQDGMIVTNRHVVENERASYSVLTNDGRTFEAQILARDPIQDLAILKIESDENFPTLKMGDSDNIRIGQTAVAIGNSLGEFRNTVSVGVVSGLGRSISATDGRTVTVLDDVIQTDAAINRGNSGGPLLNLRGEVIGINTAMALDAQNIGFSIPINSAKRMIESVLTHGEIIYPFLGIRYVMINKTIQEENNLPVDYGAWINNRGGLSIEPNSAADKAGLRNNDIILEFNSQKLDSNNPLARVILRYYPGDRVSLKVLRNREEIIIEAILGERRQ